jgi:hypothetical protein
MKKRTKYNDKNEGGKQWAHMHDAGEWIALWSFGIQCATYSIARPWDISSHFISSLDDKSTESKNDIMHVTFQWVYLQAGSHLSWFAYWGSAPLKRGEQEAKGKTGGKSSDYNPPCHTRNLPSVVVGVMAAAHLNKSMYVCVCVRACAYVCMLRSVIMSY